MFESVSTKCVRPKSVTWDTPKYMTLDLGDEKGPETYKLLKGAEDFLHKQIDVRPATSKELYKKSMDTWKAFIQERLEEANDKMTELQKFYLNKPTMLYIVSTEYREIVDIVDFPSIEDMEAFDVKHQEYNLELTTLTRTRKFFTDSRTGLVKLVCYPKDADIVKDKCTPVVMVEVNNNKSSFKLITGILIYSKFLFLPSIAADIDEDRLSSFITIFDMDRFLQYATDMAENRYSAYEECLKSPIEISARELTSICKRVGYKLELDDEAKLHPIKALSDEENNLRIQEFYNTFKDVTGESTYEILKLSDLRKTFRYNKLTLLETLEILSKEYLTYDGSKITAEVLGDIVFKLMNRNNVDRMQVDDVKRDVNNN